MEKERAIQCVPAELIERLSALGAKLWDEKNPASVHLNAILEEFEPDMRTLGQMIKQYEADYLGRLAVSERGYAEKENQFKKEIKELEARLNSVEASRGEALRRIEELKSAHNKREELLTELKIKTSEDEVSLNGKYAARMQELYDKVSKKEMEMLNRWEEKNKSVESRTQALEGDYAAKFKQLKLREKALEEDFNARKAELIKTFDRIRAGLEAKEKELAGREEAKPQKGGAL